VSGVGNLIGTIATGQQRRKALAADLHPSDADILHAEEMARRIRSRRTSRQPTASAPAPTPAAPLVTPQPVVRGDTESASASYELG